MPHSSGGGSHGGGSHSGSSHHGSGGTTRSGPVISRKPYPGAYRYVFYNMRTRAPEYYYYQGEPKKPGRAKVILLSMLISLFFVPMLVLLLSSMFYTPKKIDVSSYAAGAEVYDDAGLTAADGERLRQEMQAFLDTTGISPAVEVVETGEWQGRYSDLERFAYSEYQRLFDDEKHWLFVISYPEGWESMEFVDWEWEGMIGDDVSACVNTASEERMTDIVHKHLLRGTPQELGGCLADAFAECGGIVMRRQFDRDTIMPTLFMLAFYGLLLFLFIHEYRQKKRLSEAYKCPEGAKEYACEYCGCAYVEGTISSCPHCGAPIPVHDAQEAAQDNAHTDR